MDKQQDEEKTIFWAGHNWRHLKAKIVTPWRHDVTRASA